MTMDIFYAEGVIAAGTGVLDPEMAVGLRVALHFVNSSGEKSANQSDSKPSGWIKQSYDEVSIFGRIDCLDE
jgi:hypothetical protein